MDQIFKNRTVLLSGGLGDIGKAIALEFAKKGASVALGDIRPPENATGLIESLRAYGPAHTYHQVDVGNASAVHAWVDAAEQAIGTPDLIIANAATVTLGGVHAITPEQWAAELNVNLNGAFYMTQCATSRLLAHQRPGRVVFTGSWAAHAVHPGLPAYAVSKAGIRMLCQSMALELAPYGILVNEIAPGYVNAGLSAGLWDANPELRHQAEQRVPIKRLISAEEVARQVAYLCHPDNNHMTGSTLLMDGGLSLLT
nr:SDR family oxidoreductase [uncultured Dyadobacter sp.]